MDDEILAQIHRDLCKKGYIHYEGQVVNGEAAHFFVKDGDVIEVITYDAPDEEMLEEIKQLTIITDYTSLVTKCGAKYKK
jgi:aspartate 1-decarboxylase